MKREKFCGLFGPQGRREAFEGKAGEQMRERILSVLRQASNMGIRQFGCCCGIGFQLLAGEAVLQLKEEDDSVRLIFSMPKEAQSQKFWTQAEKERHREIFLNADQLSYHPDVALAVDASAEEYLLRQATHAVICYWPGNPEEARMLRIMDFFGLPRCNLALMDDAKEPCFAVRRPEELR